MRTPSLAFNRNAEEFQFQFLRFDFAEANSFGFSAGWVNQRVVFHRNRNRLSFDANRHPSFPRTVSDLDLRTT